MVREEILAMKAGDELNALVAKEIMGLEVSRLGTIYPAVMISLGVWSTPAQYSSLIHEACQVVKEMEDDGWLWEARKYPCKPPYEFEFYRLKEGSHYRSGVRDSVPEAICKAALLAKLVKDGAMTYEKV